MENETSKRLEIFFQNRRNGLSKEDVKLKKEEEDSSWWHRFFIDFIEEVVHPAMLEMGAKLQSHGLKYDISTKNFEWTPSLKTSPRIIFGFCDPSDRKSRTYKLIVYQNKEASIGFNKTVVDPQMGGRSTGSWDEVSSDVTKDRIQACILFMVENMENP